MEPAIIRKQFVEVFGFEKYKQFVLTLYEAFPVRDRLFFWQEQMLKNLSEHFNIRPITYEEVYLIFNQCPLHNAELKRDIVPIVDGNNCQDMKFTEIDNSSFPLSNVIAPRDLERFNYPEELEVYYCHDCRKTQMDKIVEE